jgi:hypothetical protein
MKARALLISLAFPATAFAAAHVPVSDDGIFAWIFLGFFVMILIGQLIPALLLIIGMIRGSLAGKLRKQHPE